MAFGSPPNGCMRAYVYAGEGEGEQDESVTASGLAAAVGRGGGWVRYVRIYNIIYRVCDEHNISIAEAAAA